MVTTHDTFRVIHKGIEYEFEAAEEGGYVVSVPAYPSCASQGETFEEALENAEDALRETLTAARELGLEVPDELASA
jgi:predicted RNase H-like HicB family nuclease